MTTPWKIFIVGSTNINFLDQNGILQEILVTEVCWLDSNWYFFIYSFIIIIIIIIIIAAFIYYYYLLFYHYLQIIVSHYVP